MKANPMAPEAQMLAFFSLTIKLVSTRWQLPQGPFVDPKIGVIGFAAASILKDSVNRIGDLVDDGLPNQSFKS